MNNEDNIQDASTTPLRDEGTEGREGGDDAISPSLNTNEIDKTDDVISPPLGAEGLFGASLLYNITTQVAWAIHEAWLAWMLDIYIPEVLGTGCFVKHQLVRLLDTDEAEGPVYAVQYYALNRQQYDEYMALYEGNFKTQEHERWGNNIFSFSSLMQFVN